MNLFKAILWRRWRFWLFLLPILSCYGLKMPAPGQVITPDDTAAVDFSNVPLLTLQEAVLLAMRNNPDVKNAELQRVVDKFSLAVAHNQFFPQYQLKANAQYQNGQVSGVDGATQNITLQTPFSTQFSTEVTQAYTPYSGERRVLKHASLSVTQPLLRGFGPTVTQVNLANAIDTEKSNQLVFTSQTINTIVSVVSAYYQLVEAYNSLKTNMLSLKSSQQTLKETLERIKAGKAALADQIQQRATIANTELSIGTAKNAINQSYRNLLIVLGLDPQAKINIVKEIRGINRVKLTLDESIGRALQNNPAYLQALLNYRITERGLITAKDAQKWQLDAVGTISRPLEASFSNAPLVSRSLGLNLDVPIHDLSRQQQLVNAKIILAQAKNTLDQTRNQLIVSVTDAYENLRFNEKQVALYENAIKLAKQSLDTAQLKFKYGKVSSFELTSLQTDLTTTQLGFTSQQVAYLNSIESFYQLLGTTLEKWDVQLFF